MTSLDRQRISQKGNGCIAISMDDITIDDARILRLQGYRDLGKVRPAIKRAAASSARETEALIRAQVYYRLCGVRHCQGKTLLLENGLAFENEAFQRFLEDAQQIAVFILTMGHALDQAVIDYTANDQLLMALFLETAGWLGIEAATKRLSAHLRAQARKSGCRLSPRLGPGYSYKLDGRSVIWPLEQQQTLFELFADDPVDIRILESCVMLPKISRSGLYGFLPVS
ncbi:MAG: hypothetical protein HC871_00085 [Rhizobiales bacterium]|nr:hypothetical protein [Hyphomicrobiales bacterium]